MDTVPADVPATVVGEGTPNHMHGVLMVCRVGLTLKVLVQSKTMQ